MTLYIGGIDPGSQRTGVVVVALDRLVLKGQVWIPHADEVAVAFHETIKPKGKLLDARLADLYDKFLWMLEGTGFEALVKVDRWCIEDPREAYHGKRKRATDVTLGAAFGVCCVAAHEGTLPVELVPSQTWIPKTRNRRGGRHPMKHAHARAWLKTRWPALAPLEDDEVFAAGMAIYQATGGGFAALC